MTDTSGISVVRLRPALDLTPVEDMLKELKRARNTAVVIEAGEVARVSAIGLQALLSAWITWRSDGHDFHISGATPVLREAASLLGLPPDFLAKDGASA